MKALQLEAKKRSITGRKVKILRNQGVLPGTVYGKEIDPLSVQVPRDDFVRVFKHTGETGLIHLMIDEHMHPVLVKTVDRHPVLGIPTHIEFHQVNLKEKIRANVPIVLLGESQAVKEKTGTLLQLLNEIEVEALPTDLPEHISVDISGLVNVSDHMTVKDLPIPKDVTSLSDPEIMVVKIGELVAPEPEPTPPPAEEVTAEGEEGEKVKIEGEEKEAGEKKETSEKPEEPTKKE